MRGARGEDCFKRLMSLGSCVAPSRTRQTVYVSLPVNYPPPPIPACSTQVLIVGGLPGHFRLGWENLEEWGGGGEAGGAGRPRCGSRLVLSGRGRSAERRGAGIGELRRLSPRVGCAAAWVGGCVCIWMPAHTWVLVRSERGVSREVAAESACFAARSWAGESSEKYATLQLLTSRRGPEQGSTAVASYSLLLPSYWPVQRTFKMLMVLNKGLVGGSADITSHFTCFLVII